MNGSPRRLGLPRPVTVRTARAGSAATPRAVDGLPVEAVIEDWVVEDRWWTARPLRRRYLELLLAGGRNVVVFHDLTDGRWFEQRA